MVTLGMLLENAGSNTPLMDLSDELKLHVILDSRHSVLHQHLPDNEDLHGRIQELTTMMCFTLHAKRAEQLDYRA